MSDWIVVVDDEKLSLLNARNMLKEEGMRVSCMRSGEDFLKYMETHHPDLVLLDVMMQDMDGFEVYKRFREFEKKEERKETPVIFLTGEDNVEIEKRGLEMGASDFIRKSFNRDILLKRIENTLENVRKIKNLTEEASMDGLTGFLNKAAGTARMKQACEEKTGAFAVLDLDSFKLVNDLYGHDMGDKVLQAFSEVVRKNVREDDIVCRIGGDEFVAFFGSVNDEKALKAITRRLNEELLEAAGKLIGADFSVPLGISAGVVKVPEHGREYQELFAKADRMLYQVKQNGKHDCAVYAPQEDVSHLEEEENLEKEMAMLTKIIEERNESEGALMLGMDSFAAIYRFVMRYIKRYEMVALKMLISINVENQENAQEEKSEQELEKTAGEFGRTLQETLRKSDIILYYKKNRFFLLLPAFLEEHAGKVEKRIREAWEKSGNHKGVNLKFVAEGIDFRDLNLQKEKEDYFWHDR